MIIDQGNSNKKKTSHGQIVFFSKYKRIDNSQVMT